MSLESLHQIIFFLITIIGLWLAFWVYISGKEKKINKYFFLMVMVWIFGETTPYFVFRNIPLPESILFFLPKLTVASVFVFFIFFYFFSIHFLEEEKKFRILRKIVPFVAIIGTILSLFTNLFQEKVEFTEKGMGLDLILTTEGKIIWLGFVIFLTVFIYIRFLKYFVEKKSKERLKIQYFLVGLSLWIVINLISNVFFPLAFNTFKYAYWGNYSIFLLFAFTAYAIVKRELFGIRVVLTTLLVGLISLLIFVDIIFLTQEPLARFFKALLLVMFLYFGYLLIKSVIREIQYREKLEKTYQELKKLDKAKSEFLSIASHQLRTPLSAIKGYISMLLGGSYGVLPESSRKSIENVYQSNERLIKLVNDILNVSRLEAGRIEIDFQKISLEEIINSVIDELTHGAQIKNIYLKFKKPSKPLPQITADADKIRHIILNIVDNAIRYTNRGGVIIQAQPKNHNKMIIKVKDTGLGMTRKEIAKLFKSFSRGSAGNRSYTEGSGLGLYIAKGFVEMHHGKISAESDGLGKGSTFTIEIPLKNSL